MVNKKYAVCFSGQARSFDKCYPYIKKNVLDVLGKQGEDYDIYACVEDDGDAHKVEELMKPDKIKYTSASLTEFSDELEKFNYTYFISWPLTGSFNFENLVLSQLYKLKELYHMLSFSRIKYEKVVRLRFDYIPLNPLKLKNLKGKFIVHPSPALLIEGIKKPIKSRFFSDVFGIMDMETFRDYALSIDRINENFCEKKIKFDKWTDYLFIKTHKYLDLLFRFIIFKIFKKIIKNRKITKDLKRILYHILFSSMSITPVLNYMHGKKENYCFDPETIIYLSMVNNNPKLKLVSEPIDFILLKDNSFCLIN